MCSDLKVVVSELCWPVGCWFGWSSQWTQSLQRNPRTLSRCTFLGFSKPTLMTHLKPEKNSLFVAVFLLQIKSERWFQLKNPLRRTVSCLPVHSLHSFYTRVHYYFFTKAHTPNIASIRKYMFNKAQQTHKEANNVWKQRLMWDEMWQLGLGQTVIK